MDGISVIVTSTLVLGGLYMLMAAGLTLIWSTCGSSTSGTAR